ncbi:immunoglobulin-binding protein 1-like [Mya arenaria]|uniref:immunoglobulin-binding protein 1-like n=1 Tax=Mya arenaria TaxID=6604 RepID=UPI0022DEEB28|nr:immunoglobulin-binding protein 1-like [Mya arenaria]
MAEADNSEQNLPETFKEIWDLYDILEKIDEPTGSDKVQGYVYKACELCKKAISMVNNLRLFSENEEIEEVATGEIRYMLLPAMLGYFLMKNTVRERLKVVQESKEFYTDYMRMCHNYTVTNYEVAEPKEEKPSDTHGDIPRPAPPRMPGPADLRIMGNIRATKVQRFREQKELEKRLSELRVTVEQDHVDDEVRRDYYLTWLKKWVNVCIDELVCIEDEIPILEMMAKRKGKGIDAPAKRPPMEHKSQPLRPFIITKDALQKQVYGLGYPGLPTMTIEEFFDKKVEEGTLSENVQGQGHSMQQWADDPDRDRIERECEEAEKEKKAEEDDPDELKKARDKDEYKDEHRRGWGNRKNRH